jgi:plasmid maintenance system antidote protein VapI
MGEEIRRELMKIVGMEVDVLAHKLDISYEAASELRRIVGRHLGVSPPEHIPIR